jgi:phage nucleotide-binding protein
MTMKPKRKPPSIEDRIKSVGSIERVGSHAIYGRAGSGKTTLASTFPKPLLLLDINDRGTDSIADIKGIDVIEIETLDDIEEIYYMLRERNKYKTLVFDTVTEMQKIVMKDVMQSKKKSTDRLGDWGSMARKDWGEVSGVMNKWITDFRDLPLETVFLAQERVKNVSDEEEDNDNQLTPEVGPAVMPSIATTLNAAVNVIGNTFIRMKKASKLVKGKRITTHTPTYCLRVGPNPIYSTKIRKPRSAEAPAYIEDPTFADIMNVIKGE